MSVRVYIAGAYTGDVDRNCAHAIDAGEQVRRAGFVPFIPHLFRAWEDRHPRTYEESMAMCFAWLDACHAVLRLPGASPGADREVEHARERNIPVFTDLDGLRERFHWVEVGK